MKHIVNLIQQRVRRYPRLSISVFLVALVWAVFGQTLRHDFINFDDQAYVYENPPVMRGLSPGGIGWAFTHSVSLNWHPVTMMSHMLDCSLYGLNPAGHHFTNVLLHTLAVVLLFLTLKEMTGAMWRSGFVAAIFAIHPLRAESVAWIAERKDVLSGVFFMLTLLAYVRYVRRSFSLRRYLLVLVLFALGLMSKPMLVTLPFVLLLLDYWPLRRFDEDADAKTRFRTARQLFVEKIPLLALSAAGCVGTVLAQQHWIIHPVLLSLPLRLENALLAYVNYIGQMFYPAKLALMYPHPKENVSLVGSICAGLLLVAISAWVFLGRRKWPYLLVGWFWFLGMLVPVIGLVQVGMQAHADRYTYLPQIGLYIALAWFCARLSTSERYQIVLRDVAAVVIAALLLLGYIQTSYWFNAETIWKHSLEVTSKNFVAHSNLGAALYKNGKTDEALVEFQAALALKPDDPDTYDNYGAVLVLKGRIEEAMGSFRKALELFPDDAVAHNNLGNVLLKQGQVDEAIGHLARASELEPDNAEAHNALANAFLKKGDTNSAVANYEKAIAVDPQSAGFQNNLANIFLNRGTLDQAVVSLQKVLTFDPGYPGAERNLAFALSRLGKTDEAMEHYQRAVMTHDDDADTHFRLANLLLTRGVIGDAILHYRKTLSLAPKQPEAESNLGLALSQTGAIPEAIEHFEKALLYDPANARAHNNLAGALTAVGRTREAIAHYEKALDIQSQYMEAQIGLAWVLATAPDAADRNGSRAMELAARANEFTKGGNPMVLRIFAAALAEGGRFAEAVETARRALSLATSQHGDALAGALQKELTFYRAGSPFHNAPPTK